MFKSAYIYIVSSCLLLDNHIDVSHYKANSDHAPKSVRGIESHDLTVGN